LSGATGSGKTQWLLEFLKFNSLNRSSASTYPILLWGDESGGPRVKAFHGEIFHGIPDKNLIKENPKPLFLILDDLMLNMRKDFLDLLFTSESHNWNVSVIFITQSLYGRDIRTVRANAHYLILMRNPSDQLRIRTLGSQLFPGHLKYFMDSYKDPTENKFSYLVINMHPKSKYS